jgi:hypothetical protein
MNNFPSCFRRGPGGGKPANRRPPVGQFPGEPTRRPHDRLGEVLRMRHWRFLVMPSVKGFMPVSQEISYADEKMS